ncbi:MAG: acyl-CoA dehydrogenase family protein, partial [Burkholderiales bacterium]
MVGESYPLTPEQRRLIDLADQLGREKFAGRAADYDREARFPFENYDELHAAGLLALCVPKAFGGLGADLPTYTMVAATIGRYCGATALTYNMHACTMLWIGLLADSLDMTPEQRNEHDTNRVNHFERVAKHGKIYAQPFSEGSAAAAGKAPFGTIAKKVEGGWLINGKKIFASLSGAADYYGILCTEEKPNLSMKDTLYIAVPGDSPGFSIVGDWDPLGMRGTVSRTLIMKDVFVPDSEQ